jgi:hypothetical protein
VTEAEAYEIVGVLAECYRRDPWTKERIKIWARMIADLDYRATKTAVLAWVRSERWPPTIAEIRGLVTVDDYHVPDVDRAWSEVMNNVRGVGSWGEPRWSDPIVGEVVAALRGSWQALCENLVEDEVMAERAHFLRLYEVAAGRKKRELELLGARALQEIPAAVRAQLAEVQEQVSDA